MRIQSTLTVECKDPFQEINSHPFLLDLKTDGKVGQRAFRILFQKTHSPLLRFIGKYISSPEAIQEALQETYLGVHRSLSRFEEKCKLSTWIFSLAYRKACDALTDKYKNQNVLSQEDFESESLLSAQERFPLPDESFFQGLLVHEVMNAANSLPELYKQAYQLRDIDGLSGEEAALVLGISPTLIRVRVHRARSLIVERLQKKLPYLFVK